MKQRLVYIDNLKALAIFTVVLGHVFYFTWNKAVDNVWYHFIYAYNMPLFFFISGMFAKNEMSGRQLWNKAKQLLLPFLTIGGLYAFLNDGFNKLLFAYMHFGYWFLLALFIFFCIFYVRCKLAKLFNPKSLRSRFVLDIIYLFVVYCAVRLLTMLLPESVANLLCLGHIGSQIVYFWAGFLVYQNKERVKALLNGKEQMLYCFVAVAFAILFYLRFYEGIDNSKIAMVGAFCIITLLVMLFKDKKIVNTKTQSTLSYIGSHTLEIYVLQYFFLPERYTLPEYAAGGVIA